MAIAPNYRKLRILTLSAIPLSVCLLIFIWHRNYNLLGALYDYSILTSAAGYLHSGLLPYRDFTTPLQSLSIYLCSAAELVFGKRYLALAYTNLLFGLLGYFLLLRTLKPVLSFFPRVIVATAFCVSTFFQHGILWYNSIAMLLLTLTCLQAAKLVHEPVLQNRNVLTLCLLLFLSSINKLNFHLLGFGFVILAFATHCLLHKPKIRTVFTFGGSFIVAGIVLGPAFEILLNRTTLNDFIENVFRTPTGRSAELINLLNPNLYLGGIHDFYPDSWISGVFLIGFLIYLGCLCISVLPLPEHGNGVLPPSIFAKFCPLFVFPMLFAAGLLLTATNLDTEILTSFFLVVGLVSALVLLTKYLSLSQRLVFQFAIAILAAFFLVAGSAAAFMHSRVRYWDSSWTASMLRAVRKERSLSAMNNAVPFFKAEAISPDLAPYFAGVHFTERSQKQLERATTFMSRFKESKSTLNICWGPGLEILNRVYGSQRKGRLPLWYHIDVSVRNRDASRIIGEFERVQYEWIVVAELTKNMPAEVVDYIQNKYDRVENDEIIVFHRKL